MMSNRWRLSALAAVLWACWPAGSFAAADEIRFALGPAEAQSVPTNSDYQARIGPRIDYSLKDLHFVNEMVGYAVGTGRRLGQAPVVYKTTDGGEHWLPRLPCAGRNPVDIAFADEARGLVTLHDTTGCPEACEHRTAALITDDGGESWDRLEYPELQGQILEVVFDPAGNAFGLLFRLRIDHGSPDPPEPTITLLRSADSGRSWQRLRTLPPQAETPQFALRHHQDKLYLTWADASILVFDARGEWLETIDTGYDSVTDLVVVSGSTLLATVFRSGATHRLIRSIDGGRTWKVLLDEQAKIAFARSSDEFGVIVHRGWADRPADMPISLDVIAHTKDGGRTWRESTKILGLMSSIKRSVRPSASERDRLLLNDRILEIEHARRQ